MGTVLLLIVVLGVVLFVAGLMSPPAKQAVSSRRADAASPAVHKAVAGENLPLLRLPRCTSARRAWSGRRS